MGTIELSHKTSKFFSKKNLNVVCNYAYCRRTCVAVKLSFYQITKTCSVDIEIYDAFQLDLLLDVLTSKFRFRILGAYLTQKPFVSSSTISDTKVEDESGVLTDKDINRISYHIGKEYQSLAFELGLSKEELDRINLDFSTAIDRIRSVLLRWKRKEEKGATVECLKSAMEAVGVDVDKALGSIKEHK